jgi:hypothetical protein
MLILYFVQHCESSSTNTSSSKQQPGGQQRIFRQFPTRQNYQPTIAWKKRLSELICLGTTARWFSTHPGQLEKLLPEAARRHLLLLHVDVVSSSVVEQYELAEKFTNAVPSFMSPLSARYSWGFIEGHAMIR